MRMQQVHKDLFSSAELCKSCGQNRTSQTGYETWICKLGKKSFVNLDIKVNKR
jgi:ribosomal protein L37AE/L43A